jgi:acyl-CoA synthetase (AMP-forming)/AMP-acid ligase II
MQKVKRGGVGLLITEVTDKAPFEGYTDAAASEKKLLRNVFSKGDVWFNTGDLVRDQGWHHVQFIDRLGDTFRWKGENVATTEVENALNSFGQVSESVVYGIELPGTDGRAGMAAITLNCAPGEFEAAAFASHVRERLPAYAVPLFLRLRPEQEITGTFKYRKVDLKREGYRAEEPVFVLLPGGGAYERIDDRLIARIESRELRW